MLKMITGKIYSSTNNIKLYVGIIIIYFTDQNR